MEKIPEIKDLYVDIGVSSKEEVEKLGIDERDILDRIPGSSELIRVSKGSRERVIEC